MCTYVVCYVICAFTLFSYMRLTVPEGKNNNTDDRYIKKRENKSYCQFFLFFFSLSPFLLFRLVVHIKKTEAKRRKKQLIDQHHYRRHCHTRSSYDIASQSDHLLTYIYTYLYIYIYIYIDCVFFVVVRTLLLQ